jgi:predicted lipid-binding transport protein (Tim44 family)
MAGFLDWLLTLAFIVASWTAYATLRHGPVLPPGAEDKVVPPPAPTSPAPAEARALPLDRALALIARKGGFADLAAFMAGARRAYEEIIDAFARGNLEPVAPLLGPAVRTSFADAIGERRQRGETLTSTFIGFLAAEPVDAGVDGETAWVDVRFLAQMVSVTRARDGSVAAGHPRRVVEIGEIWTFQRELRSPDPNWLLVATDTDE